MFVQMDIGKHIKDLLYRYDCVILPGFGAFLTQYQPASIEAGNYFYPPSKSLSFNRQLQTNDGILAHYIASLENCSYEVALQKVRNFTAKISRELSEGVPFMIQEIGAFRLNSEKKIVFTPSDNTNFNRSSFGLSQFNVPVLEREIVSDTIAQETVKQSNKSAPVPWMRYAAIGVLAITLGGFSGLKIYEGKVAEYNWTEKQKADSLLENEIQEATFIISNPLPTMTISVPKQNGKYHIVAGAFRVEANAQKKISQLVQKGFAAKLIGTNKYGLHQVVYGSFQERDEALKALRDIRTSESKDAWLLIQELP